MIKKITFLAGMLLLLVIGASAQTRSEDKLVGVWLTEDKTLKFEFFKSGNTYSGKLLWAKDMFLADGKTPKKDEHNPDQKLRSRSRQGIVNITGLVYKDGEYTDGKLYNPQDGSTYDLNIKMVSLNKIDMRGYKGIAMLGKTFRFNRVQ